MNNGLSCLLNPNGMTTDAGSIQRASASNGPNQLAIMRSAALNPFRIMASNTFLIEGRTTTVTFLSDKPIEGENVYGPYRAYPVQTEQGDQTTFYPPKYLFGELDQRGVCRGMTVRLRASEARTRDNRRYTRIEIEDAEKPASAAVTERLPSPMSQRGESPDNRNGILASVALKAATSTRGIVGEPQEIIDTAVLYLAWLKSA